MSASSRASTAAEPAAATSQEAPLSLLGGAGPPQGAWTADAYLRLTDHDNRLIEFTAGSIRELPMPTSTHQAIVAFLYDQFRAYLRPRGGVVMFAALRLRVSADKFREPDLLMLRDRSDRRYQDRYWLGADLVVEVVSPDYPARDLIEKRADYAAAGIPEYWIADPRDRTITVLTLSGDAYAAHGSYGRGEAAASPLLAGFAAEVDAVFGAPGSAP